jgi:hypothetical protein
MNSALRPGLTRKAGLALALVAVLAAAGCREEEQGRVTNFDAGVYKGPEDQALDPETVNALRARALQGQTTP